MGLISHDLSLLTLPLGCWWSWQKTCLSDAHALQALHNLSARSPACVYAAGLHSSKAYLPRMAQGRGRSGGHFTACCANLHALPQLCGRATGFR